MASAVKLFVLEVPERNKSPFSIHLSLLHPCRLSILSGCQSTNADIGCAMLLKTALLSSGISSIPSPQRFKGFFLKVVFLTVIAINAAIISSRQKVLERYVPFYESVFHTNTQVFARVSLGFALANSG